MRHAVAQGASAQKEVGGAGSNTGPQCDEVTSEGQSTPARPRALGLERVSLSGPLHVAPHSAHSPAAGPSPGDEGVGTQRQNDSPRSLRPMTGSQGLCVQV